MSPEAKLKMSESTKTRKIPAMLGKKHSEETKKQISEARKGRKCQNLKPIDDTRSKIMNVRAKFKVVQSDIIDYSGNPMLTLRMEAVYNDGDPENAQWSKWTQWVIFT